MSYEDNITKLGLKLPEPKAPAGNYVATKIVGRLLGDGEAVACSGGECKHRVQARLRSST